MAALTYQATRRNDNLHTVARSTADTIGTATAALIIDNTASKLAVHEAVRALLRALNRDGVSGSAPADYSTSASSVE